MHQISIATPPQDPIIKMAKSVIYQRSNQPTFVAAMKDIKMETETNFNHEMESMQRVVDGNP